VFFRSAWLKKESAGQMSARIMIVEDEALVALELEAILEDLGYDPVGIAADSSSALRLIAKQPDLALVDLNLRDGPTGPQVGEALARKHGVKVLFMTANPRMLGDGIAGTVGVLTKPCDAQTVEAAVAYVLRRTVTPPPALKVFGESSRG
jgi:two-component system, response regulator PdtaR